MGKLFVLMFEKDTKKIIIMVKDRAIEKLSTVKIYLIQVFWPWNILISTPCPCVFNSFFLVFVPQFLQ